MSLPRWRSILSVPINIDRFVEGAHRREADAIQLDLEDSIPLSEKEDVRRRLPRAIAAVSQSGADVIVRINQPWNLAEADLDAAVLPGVAAITLPKVEDPEQVRAVSEAISRHETRRRLAPGAIRLLLLIETPAALFRLPQIANADTRVVAMKLGSEDFALAAGMAPEPDGLYLPSMTVLMAARAAGLLPLGFIGSIAQYQDLDAFRTTVRRARRLGFCGASVIHPRLVPILNEEFSPSPEEIESARRIVEAYEQAQLEGKGSVQVDGKMVDVPVFKRALQILSVVDADRSRMKTSRS